MATHYVEIVAQGSFKLLKGFLCGYYVNCWDSVDFFFNRDLNIKAQSLLQQIKDRIGIRPERVHFIIDEARVAELKQAITKVERWLHVTIREVRPIRQASLEFAMSAYTEEDGNRLLHLLHEERPESIELFVCKECEPQNTPEGKGIEVYAPLHEYEIHLEGTLRGEVGDLIKYGWRLMHETLITLDEIELEYDLEGYEELDNE